MPIKLDDLSPYIIPPLLSFAIQLALAGLVLTRGLRRPENIRLAVVSFWWSLLAPIFIAHHIVTDEALLLKIERSVHFVYVFVTPVTLHFIHRVYGLSRLPLVLALGLVSAVFAYFTTTDAYFYGFYKFEWGTIARGGPAFDLFGLYTVLGLIYGLGVCFLQLRRETGQLARLKIKYITFSFLTVAALTLLNVPAIKGYNVYPVGNFLFIPLAFLIYGILRHRVLNPRFVFRITLPRLIFSSLILLPNYFVLRWLKPVLSALDPLLLLMLFVGTFLANLFYFQRVQPQIDRLFEKRRKSLVREFGEKKRDQYRISHIKGVDLDDLGVRLKSLMEEERAYCDEDLTLARLAAMLDLSTHQLSEYLNRHLQKSFYGYLNEYRIREAKALLKEDQRSVLDIALAVGYNSRSAFYRAFREETGMTPRRYAELDAEWKGKNNPG